MLSPIPVVTLLDFSCPPFLRYTYRVLSGLFRMLTLRLFPDIGPSKVVSRQSSGSLPPPPIFNVHTFRIIHRGQVAKEVEIYTNTVRTISRTCDEHNACRPVYIHRRSLPMSSNAFAGWAQQVPDIRIYTFENHALQLGPLLIHILARIQSREAVMCQSDTFTNP